MIINSNMDISLLVYEITSSARKNVIKSRDRQHLVRMNSFKDNTHGIILVQFIRYYFSMNN